MAHSYSSWSTFNKCAARYKYSYLDKLPGGEPSPAMARGTRIHESIEKFMLGSEERLDKEIHKMNGMFMSQLKDSHTPIPEHRWALTKKFELTDFDDASAYVRGVIDLKAQQPDVVHLFEWKTGKVYPEHQDQAHLYATVGLIEHEVDKITVSVRYLDFGTQTDWVHPRSDLRMMRARWRDRLKQVDREKTFAPNPSFDCRRCPYNRESGGPCPVG